MGGRERNGVNWLTGESGSTCPWLFLDSGVSWKGWKRLEKPRENVPRFLGFSFCAQEPGAG